MSVRVLIRDHPHRTVALTTSDHTLVFRHSPSAAESDQKPFLSTSAESNKRQHVTARCMVEFAARSAVDLAGYRSVSTALGTLGLITLANDVFLCAITGASQVATVRPGEIVQKIHSVEFYCLNRGDYDHTHGNEPELYPSDPYGLDEIESAAGFDQGYSPAEHPFLALRKLLGTGHFYYSCEFDLTSRLQQRAEKDASLDIDDLDEGLLWNSYMVNPLLQFRSRLEERERIELDKSRMLTSVIRGFVKSLTIPPSAAPIRKAGAAHLPSTLTVISRLSSRRAGTRFNSRGIDDDGNVANFVETETIFWSPSGVCFSYLQIRGSVPIFWESATTLIPGQQKIQVTRSSEATQPAFDKHFERLTLMYGAVHIVNLLSGGKAGEIELTEKYRHHLRGSPLRQGGGKNEAPEHHLLRLTEFDFHAETKGAGGYAGARAVRPYLETSSDGFAYFMSEEISERPEKGSEKDIVRRPVVVLQQEGIFRVNCLDSLDRTNLVQGMISQIALEAFLAHRSEVASPDFWMRHSSLWADNGDTLSKIYAGTGALKSSFTRHGRMSLSGAIADARKSATRLYVNNFADKARQNTIDVLLGRMMDQTPVDLYDPVNDHVVAELSRHAPEYTSSQSIRMWCGTFNLNGKSQGASQDLSPWLCPVFGHARPDPEIMAVAFQEIVELSPQQIMSTDPARRIAWENAVKKTLNSDPNRSSSDDYVLLRSGQLVGAALLIFVKSDVLAKIKNVEGAIKKTGMSGIAGNKGAVAIRLEYASTSLCFVTGHLAAGFANYEERNRDYQTISHGLRFQKNRSIEDHDSIIWFGDFNYRIGLSDDRARRLVHLGDLDTLYENDQLNIQMVAGTVFKYYSESRITFPPTYRFDIATDDYDTSEKARIPAWCDRILSRGTNLRQIDYNMAPLRFSDHRPVFGTFECAITIVDEAVKAGLTQRLYDKRKAEVGSRHAAADGGKDDDSDSNSEEEADLMGYEPVDPDLPPASSDRRKWWLDNDQPARSELRPPQEGMVPNPHRPVNPYRREPIEEPDWVEVRRPGGMDGRRSVSHSSTSQKPAPPPTRRTGRSGVATADGAANPGNGVLKPPPPPAPRSISGSTSTSTITSGRISTSTIASGRTSTIASGRVAPPPKPTKPPSLTSPPSQTSTFDQNQTPGNGLTKPVMAQSSVLSQPGPDQPQSEPRGVNPKPAQPAPHLPPRTNTSSPPSSTNDDLAGGFLDQRTAASHSRMTLRKPPPLPPNTTTNFGSRSGSGSGRHKHPVNGGMFDPKLPIDTHEAGVDEVGQKPNQETPPRLPPRRPTDPASNTESSGRTALLIPTVTDDANNSSSSSSIHNISNPEDEAERAEKAASDFESLQRKWEPLRPSRPPQQIL